ncbi:MAG: hypothetical protein N2486_05765 [Caloramator sp.]|nr:hypothetical protein [Caloramator sp.]
MKPLIKGVILLFIFILQACNYHEDNIVLRPMMSKDYEMALEKIKYFISPNSKLTFPLEGENRDSIYIFDYDGDEINDTVYLIKTSDLFSPLKLGLIKSSSFINAVSYGFVGSEIHKFYYSDLDKDGKMEFIIGNYKNKSKELFVLKEIEGILRIIFKTDYEDFTIKDIDEDGTDEILLIKKEGELPYLNVLKANGEKFNLLYVVPLDKGIKYYKNITYSRLNKSQNGIIIDGLIGEELSLTQVLVIENKGIKNLFLNPITNVCENGIKAYYIRSRDIDGDGFIEIAVPEINNNFQDKNLWIDNWYKIDEKGNLVYSCSTYNGGIYYFVIPKKVQNNFIVKCYAGNYECISFYFKNSNKYLFSLHNVKEDRTIDAADKIKILDYLNYRVYIDYDKKIFMPDEIEKNIFTNRE